MATKAASVKYLISAGIPAAEAEKAAAFGIDWRALFEQFRPMLIKLITDFLSNLGKEVPVPPPTPGWAKKKK